ncbi:MAG: hypothetical protein HZB67_02955 [Candidatus Aenigmarchaeota archaeon]|nr:hypothetical protein [Candidatus Aenigmarchaeota archaeon]
MSYESRNMLPYVRELGLAPNYVSMPRKEYPLYIAGVSVFDISPRYMPHDSILGMTDSHTMIWLRNDLGPAREEVLQHEINHVKYPVASESKIREITRCQMLAQGKPCYYH